MIADVVVVVLSARLLPLLGEVNHPLLAMSGGSHLNELKHWGVFYNESRHKKTGVGGSHQV